MDEGIIDSFYQSISVDYHTEATEINDAEGQFVYRFSIVYREGEYGFPASIPDQQTFLN